MKIAVYGAWHVKNFGDVLLFDLYCQIIREVYPECTIVALENSDALDDANVMSNENVTQFTDGMQVLKECNLMVYLGGGYFQEPNVSYLKRFKWGLNIPRKHIVPALYAKYYDVPIRVIGVGVGPITNPVSNLLVRLLYRATDKAAVRDLESRKFFSNKSRESVRVIPDLGLYTKEMMGIKSGKKSNKIGVHLYEAPSKDRRLHEVVRLMKKIKEEESHKIYFVKDKGGQDRRQLRALKEVNNLIEGQIEYSSPNQFVSDLNCLDTIITNKLHVGIVGVSLGKTVISLPYHSKTRRFYSQIGRPDLCLDLNNYTSEDIYKLMNQEKSKKSKSQKYQFPSHEDVVESVKRVIS